MPDEDKQIPIDIKFDTLREVTTNESRGVTVALKLLKESILKFPTKKIRILTDWIVKRAMLLDNESTFRPESLKKYRQREIILVDFGFNVGGEFGGRHYAVVLEKNNNPKSSVILVAPITSYDPDKGETSRPSNVDLGIRAINNYEKGASVVVNQIRNISKMRIEKPKTSSEEKNYMPKEKFEELLKKFKEKIFLDI